MPDQKHQRTASIRKLAAIMFTDIAGYTALMGKDSGKAMDLVRQNKAIQKPLVEKHQGIWLKEMGDGSLAQFNTALDAVKCALEIQRTSRADLDAKLRIGIHLGDITIENNDVFGDGVNIASRLETIADPGGIYISDSVEKAIRGQSDIKSIYLGEIHLKNVNYGVRSYAIQAVGLPVPTINPEKQISSHFSAELIRRGVLRAGFTYVSGALLVIILMKEEQSILNFSDGLQLLITIALTIGFVASLILAWFYERSPKGFVRTSSISSWQNPLKPEERKPFTSTIIPVILLLATLFVYAYPKMGTSNARQATHSERVLKLNLVFLDNAPLALIGETPSQYSSPSIEISPDGKILAYIAQENNRSTLHIRYFENGKDFRVSGTEGAYAPCFSPDGKWVAFGVKDMLKKVKVPDGSPVDIASVGFYGGSIWTENDDIYFDGNNNIIKVSAKGGIPELILERDANMVIGHSTGFGILPDGKNILYSELTGDIYTFSLETGQKQLIYPKGGGTPKYISSGHLIFSRKNALFGVAFDPITLQALGNENQIISNIRMERAGPQLSYTLNGMAIHVKGDYYQTSEFFWIDKKGHNEKIDLQTDSYGSFDLSPNGDLLAISMLPAENEIKIYDMNTGRLKRIKVKGAQLLYSPVWGPENESILFSGSIDGKMNLYRKNVNQVGEPEIIAIEDLKVNEFWPTCWSNNGEYTAIQARVLRMVQEEGKVVLGEFIKGTTHTEFSPDNNFIVYSSEEQGDEEVFVQPFPTTGEKWLVSIDGGTDPIWANDGKMIFYHNDLKIYSVKVNTSSNGSLSFQTPELYYSGPFVNAVSRSLSISPDDSKILILKPASGEQLVNNAIVTINWFDELKRLAPVSQDN